MADWLITIGFCAMLAAAGWPWVPVLCRRRPPFLGRAGLGYLLGTAFVTLGMLAVAAARVPLTRVSILAIAVACCLTGALLAARRGPAESPVFAPGSRRAAYPLLCLAAGGIAYLALLTARAEPLNGVDFLSFWGRKGIAVFNEHNLDFTYLKSDSHTYYPLEVSNLYGALYLVLGDVDDGMVRLPLMLFAVSLAASTWWLCRLVLSPVFAAAAVALPVTVPAVLSAATSGNADFAMAAYVTVAVLSTFHWVREGDAAWAPLAGAAAGAAAWCKVEALLTCGVLLLTVLLLRRSLRVRGVLPWLAWFSAFVVPWFVFRQIHDIARSQEQFAFIRLDPIWIVVHVGEKLVRFADWGAFWPATLLVVALSVPLWWSTPWRLLAALTLPNVALSLGAFVAVYDPRDAAVEVTVTRLYVHLAPSVAVLAAAATAVAWEAYGRGSVRAAASGFLAQRQQDQRPEQRRRGAHDEADPP